MYFSWVNDSSGERVKNIRATLKPLNLKDVSKVF